MKPKIVIVAEDGFDRELPHFIVPCDYGTAVGQAGGLPLVALDAKHPEYYAQLGDGLLLTGGNDIHCAWYGEVYQTAGDMPALSRSREMLEFTLCKLFLQAGKPVFGIGRGMQVLNVALGGTLHRHIEGHRTLSDAGVLDFCRHPLEILPSHPLSALLPSEANSCHHQAIKTLGQDLVAVAQVGDIVEAIAHKALPAFGVQWHPERNQEGAGLFEHFVALCKENGL